MSILILMLSLNHCSSTDILNVGAGIYGGMEKKPNPMGAIKLLKKKDKNEWWYRIFTKSKQISKEKTRWIN